MGYTGHVDLMHDHTTGSTGIQYSPSLLWLWHKVMYGILKTINISNLFKSLDCIG